MRPQLSLHRVLGAAGALVLLAVLLSSTTACDCLDSNDELPIIRCAPFPEGSTEGCAGLPRDHGHTTSTTVYPVGCDVVDLSPGAHCGRDTFVCESYIENGKAPLPPLQPYAWTYFL